jgi:hypothetical protein
LPIAIRAYQLELMIFIAFRDRDTFRAYLFRFDASAFIDIEQAL